LGTLVSVLLGALAPVAVLGLPAPVVLVVDPGEDIVVPVPVWPGVVPDVPVCVPLWPVVLVPELEEFVEVVPVVWAEHQEVKNKMPVARERIRFIESS
jgi:hypothetical protein